MHMVLKDFFCLIRYKKVVNFYDPSTVTWPNNKVQNNEEEEYSLSGLIIYCVNVS